MIFQTRAGCGSFAVLSFRPRAAQLRNRELCEITFELALAEQHLKVAMIGGVLLDLVVLARSCVDSIHFRIPRTPAVFQAAVF